MNPKNDMNTWFLASLIPHHIDYHEYDNREKNLNYGVYLYQLADHAAREGIWP